MLARSSIGGICLHAHNRYTDTHEAKHPTQCVPAISPRVTTCLASTRSVASPLENRRAKRHGKGRQWGKRCGGMKNKHKRRHRYAPQYGWGEGTDLQAYHHHRWKRAISNAIITSTKKKLKLEAFDALPMPSSVIALRLNSNKNKRYQLKQDAR